MENTLMRDRMKSEFVEKNKSVLVRAMKIEDRKCSEEFRRITDLSAILTKGETQ